MVGHLYGDKLVQWPFPQSAGWWVGITEGKPACAPLGFKVQGFHHCFE